MDPFTRRNSSEINLFFGCLDSKLVVGFALETSTSFRFDPSNIVGVTRACFFVNMLIWPSIRFVGWTFEAIGVGGSGNLTGWLLSVVRLVEIVMRVFFAIKLAGSGFEGPLKRKKKQFNQCSLFKYEIMRERERREGEQIFWEEMLLYDMKTALRTTSQH